MDLEQILRHPLVSNIDVRHGEDGFSVYAWVWDGKQYTYPRPEHGATLQEALDKVVKRRNLS